jgi:hypothetical protein
VRRLEADGGAAATRGRDAERGTIVRESRVAFAPICTGICEVRPRRGEVGQSTDSDPQLP